jgi:hypothetical protein
MPTGSAPKKSAGVAGGDAQHVAPFPLPEDDPWQTDIDRERYNLWRLYKAELSLYQGEPDDWYEEITPILNADPDNPYYAWLFDASLSGGS